MKVTLSTAIFAILATVAAAQDQFNPAAFPPVNAVPPIDSPEVKEWLKGLNFADVPKFPVHTGNPPACPALAQIPADQCWWTCQTCPADDIERCIAPGVWGMTFDDGPTPNTPLLLESLKAHKAKATFFVMGSNVVRNAEVLKQEVADGHHIASHTWSHHPLTTLSNEQIVAELKWTEKAVMDITGLHMKYVRPPYGDIDNRVRAVVKKLGYTVVDWTSDAYDSKDFNLNAGYTEATLSAAVTKMATTLKAYGANPGTQGVITLEHDLYPVTVEFAKRLLPVAAEAKLQIQTIAQCLNDANGYQNTPPPATGNNTGNGGKGPNVVHPNNAAAASSMVSGGLMAAGLAIVGAAIAAL
ncbi:chitin deacetylase [Haplosporangium sp. Z 767]|nr:chitin deacetylase [Haplosporangium sp. Z 11]KAF9178928.1 chitin deacetylase [Haplosporangium sp. Z 767]